MRAASCSVNDHTERTKESRMNVDTISPPAPKASGMFKRPALCGDCGRGREDFASVVYRNRGEIVCDCCIADELGDAAPPVA